MLKSGLREKIREDKRRFVREELDEMALDVIRRLTVHPRFAAARTVMLYHSLPDEVDTRRLLAGLASVSGLMESLESEVKVEECVVSSVASASYAGKTILLPRVTSATDMELRLYTGPDDLSRGAFGIMEPCGALFTDYSRIDLAVIPGMAFDRHGHRLGRGRGYYDRFLPLIPHAYKIGICFPFQLVDAVPTEPTDVIMDEVMW
ncbi:MAG: 5-formyltetrahydrofolate cyclo-ligase [Prevotella sp.]|nr:5-formyltetrahydrofolate cyclo-ligase [Prevotella sp.]